MALRRQTKDSTLAYYVNQLENLDPRLYMPLSSVSWSRDLKLRSGVGWSQEATSYIRSNYSAPGSLAVGTGNAGGNMSWISPETTIIPGIDVNGEKIMTPLRLGGREISYTSVELDRSQATQQPIDIQKLTALKLNYEMNIDQMAYIGDSIITGSSGLLNRPDVTATSVGTGISGLTTWVSKTPTEILADVNLALQTTWTNSALAVCPSKLLLPPAQFSYLASQLISSAGNMSILKFLQLNSIALSVNGKELDIQPVKWLTGRGTGPTDRMVVYTNDEQYVRYPMVPIRRETAYYSGIRFAAPYIWMLGEVETVYVDTISYWDGI